MLVLSRKVGESIIIDSPRGNVTVKVMSIRGATVRLGFEGPRSISIARDDVKTDWLGRVAAGMASHQGEGG